MIGTHNVDFDTVQPPKVIKLQIALRSRNVLRCCSRKPLFQRNPLQPWSATMAKSQF
jgi:hypothetical protein